jgi:hypothetical protein
MADEQAIGNEAIRDSKVNGNRKQARLTDASQSCSARRLL